MAGQQRDRAHHGLDDSFMEHGTCANPLLLDASGTAPADFYRENGKGLRDREATIRARQVCEQCPVQAQCLSYAVDGRIFDGIWGGTDGPERLALSRRRRRAASV